VNKIVKFVENILIPILDKYNYELVDVEFKKEGKNHFLRVFIDKEGGITIDDCQIVNEELSEILDKEDPIPYRYYLEVSSPGLDRPLKKDRDFERNKGRLVDIKLKEPLYNKRQIEGKLVDKKDDMLVIDLDGEIIKIPMNIVVWVKVAIKF